MQEGKKDDNFDPEDEPNNDQVPPLRSDGEEPEANSKPKQKMPWTKQHRGRGNLAERDDLESPEPDADDSVSKGQVPKVSMSSPVSLPKISIPREDMPKWAAGEDSEALPKRRFPPSKLRSGGWTPWSALAATRLSSRARSTYAACWRGPSPKSRVKAAWTITA